MSTSTQVEARDGRPVVVKRAVGPSVAGLAEEARRLQQSTHPGVVEVVSAGPVGDGFELAMVHAGNPLCALAPLSAREVARSLACVATTVADLHDLGIVHGRIDSSHVLLGSDGRAILCGLGPGTAAPAPTPADDVEALGLLLTDLLGTSADLEPIPDRRWRVRRPRADWERRALLSVADLACADVPTRRPTARRLASSLVAACPAPVHAVPVEVSPLRGAQSDDPFDRLRASAPDPASGPWRPRLLGLAGLIVLAIAVSRTVPGGPLASTHPARPATPPTTVDLAEHVGEVATSGEIEVEGRVLTVDGQRFEVGQPGDQVVVGDWDCDGTTTPAVLRPSSTEVFVFNSWGQGSPVEVGPVRRVPGAASLMVTEASGCSMLAVRTAAHEVVEIVVAGSA